MRVVLSLAILLLGAANLAASEAFAEDGVLAPPVISERDAAIPSAPKQRRKPVTKAGAPKPKAKPSAAQRAPVKAVNKTPVPNEKAPAAAVSSAKKKKVARKKAVHKSDAYTCAGLNGDDLEAVFSAEVAFQGPDGTYECALSTFDSTVGVAVSKQDTRTSYTFAPREGGQREDFGKDAVSYSFLGETRIEILMRGGRLLKVWAPNIEQARQVSTTVWENWPELNEDQKADISSGSCPGARGSTLDAKLLSPHVYDVVMQVTDNSAAAICGLTSEGGDLSIFPINRTLLFNSDPKVWDPKVWVPLGNGVTGYIASDEPKGFQKVYVISPTFGILYIAVVSQNSGRVGYARFVTFAEQDKFVRELAGKLAKS
jgi:hypothetical protein